MYRFLYSFMVLILATVDLDGGLQKLIQQPEVQKHISKKVQEGQEKKGFSYQLAAVLIFKDEAPYLKEWIEYHRLLGFDLFYLYNNLSEDEYQEVLSPYIRSGIVKLKKWTIKGGDLGGWNAAQCTAYSDALGRARKDRVKWLAIIDSDEFLVPRHTDSLVNFLKKYENDVIGQLHIFWVMFGTSFVEKIPSDKLLIETLLLNEGYVSGGSKPIVRPHRVNPHIMGGPHHQVLLKGYKALELSTNEIQCNHYWTRDEHYLFNFKIPRRIIWGTPPEACQTWRNNFNRETSASEPILRFISPLRKRMHLQ